MVTKEVRCGSSGFAVPAFVASDLAQPTLRVLRTEDPDVAVRRCTQALRLAGALDGCTFAARPGRLTGFLGPNGAGKTTAMRAVFGLVQLDEGLVRWRGHRSSRPTVPFGYMPEERGLYPRMRVREQLLYLGELCGRTSGGRPQRRHSGSSGSAWPTGRAIAWTRCPTATSSASS